MVDSLLGCLPVSEEEGNETDLKLLCSTTKGYQLLDNTRQEKRAYDHLAASQASQNNYSAFADFISTLYDETGIVIDADISSDEAAISVGGQEVKATPAAALLYSGMTGGQIEWLEEEESLEDIGLEIQLPDEDNWMDISVQDSNEAAQLEDGYDQEVKYTGYEIRDCRNPNCSAPHPLMTFTSEDERVSKVPVPDNASQVAGKQFRRDIKKKVMNGEFERGSNMSPASVTAYPEDDVSLTELEKLDVGSLASLILEQEDVGIENIVKVEEGGKRTYSKLGGQITETPIEIFSAMYPIIFERAYTSKSDLRAENNLVEGPTAFG